MDYSLSNLIKFFVLGGILGGVIALVGYFILRPSTDSLILFLLLRMLVGAVVATIVGPMIVRAKK